MSGLETSHHASRASVDELAALRTSVRDFLRSALPSVAVRRVIDATAGVDGDAWRALSADLGLTGIGIPAEFGGAGYSFVELGIVLEELGRSIAPLPYLSSAVVAATALVECADDEHKRALLPGIADGTLIASLASGVPALTMSEGQHVSASSLTEGGHRLDGRVARVADARIADLLLVSATFESGWALFTVRPDADGVHLEGLEALDGTRLLSSVDFRAAPATLVGRGPVGWEGLTNTASALAAAVACEQVGGAAQCLDMIVDNARTRVQFGRPIGSFQAIQHRCADLLVELEAARSIAYDARDRVARRDPGMAETSSAAKSWCSETYVHLAQENIQLHGGIGFTWEHDAHLHLRRARSGQLLNGTPREHRRALAEVIGL